MQNIEMMVSEPREYGPNVNIVMQSGIATKEDKEKQPKADGWVCKAVDKEVGLDLGKEKETFMEEKKSFMEAYTLGTQGTQTQKPKGISTT